MRHFWGLKNRPKKLVLNIYQLGSVNCEIIDIAMMKRQDNVQEIRRIRYTKPREFCILYCNKEIIDVNYKSIDKEIVR